MRKVEGLGVIVCVFYTLVLFDSGSIYQSRSVAAINETIDESIPINLPITWRKSINKNVELKAIPSRQNGRQSLQT